MRTLIRASQLNSDVSGLVKQYADPLYPNYHTLSGVSGIKSTPGSNSTLYFSLQNFESGMVNGLNGLHGNVFVTGRSGIYTYSDGTGIYFSLTGGNFVNKLNTLTGSLTLSGAGTIDIWPYSPNIIAISGMSITGEKNIVSYVSGNIIRLSAQTVSKLNSVSGAVNLVGSGGANIIVNGQNIIIDATNAARSGVGAINNLRGDDITIAGAALGNIDVYTNPYLNTISLSYIGSGFGQPAFIGSNVSSTYFIGSNNTFYSPNNSIFANSINTVYSGNNQVTAINSSGCSINNNTECSVINSNISAVNNTTGATLINGNNINAGFNHPYSLGIGNSSNNSYFATINLKALVSGGQVLKAMKVAKTNYSGIKVPTGCALIGHIDYYAVKYSPVTDFLASFPNIEQTIYGRKYFIATRGTNLQTQIKDQADLFGGTDRYGVFIESGNDASIYLYASGNSSESTIFHACVQYSQFALDTSYD